MTTPEKNLQGENRKSYAQSFTVHHQKIKSIKDKIDERRNKVYRLKLQGYSPQEIADELEISLSTVEKDIHHMKYFCLKWSKDIITESARKPFVDSYTQIEIVQKELWKIYRAEKDNKVKKRILDAIITNSLKQDKLVQYRRLEYSEENKVEEIEKALTEEAEKEASTG